MRRREFIRRASLAAVAAGAPLPLALQAQTCPVVDLPRTLVNVMLHGGADFRYLIVPAPDHPVPDYVAAMWAARRVLYEDSYESYASMFEAEYLPVTDQRSGVSFGIHRSSAWLRDEFAAGNVAIVANAVCSQNRRHDQSILNADAGVPDLEILNFDRDGWGGRLNELLPGSTNVVELGGFVSVFSKGTDPEDRMARVVQAANMRDMTLAGPSEQAPGSRESVIARALDSYYSARATEVAVEKSSNWPYHQWFQHHDAIQSVARAVEARLDACGPLPEELQSLNLYNGGFVQQCANLYDACRLPDVLGIRLLSMSYGNFDTHTTQAGSIGQNLSDLFGSAGGLATVFSHIDNLPYLERPARDNMVMYFASDFGRQLAANGSGGTDHGSGTYTLVVGKPVGGGVYGDLFPVREIMPDHDGLVPVEVEGADILGRTSTERLLAGACDWLHPGSGSFVFPGAAASALESGVDLSNLFSA